MINWWNNIDFAYGWALWLLLLVPVLVLFLYFMAGKGRPVVSLSSFRYLEGVKAPGIVKWRIALYFLRLAALVLIILAFARPQTKTEFEPDKGEGIDIIICMDVSESMNNRMTDTSDAKLEIAKREAIRFINKRPNDRIGVVLFAGEAITSSPITTDHTALNHLIENIQFNQNMIQGTAIGMGLATAVERLEGSDAKSKVVVLLTDGENNQGMVQPLEAAQLAKTYKIRVYSIGLSALYGSSVRNPDGSLVSQYQKASFDEHLLQQIAQATGGKEFHATDGQKLEQIYQAINKMEKTEFETKGHWRHHEEAAGFLLPALLLLMIEFALRYTVFDSLT